MAISWAKARASWRRSLTLADIYGRRFKGVPPLKLATGQITASILILLALAGLVDQPWSWPAPSAEVWFAFAGIALLSTALAYILYFRGGRGRDQPPFTDLPAAY